MTIPANSTYGFYFETSALLLNNRNDAINLGEVVVSDANLSILQGSVTTSAFSGSLFNKYLMDMTIYYSLAVAPPASIPTLSEWGLIILSLLLMTLGTLYLVQPNWRRRFEQE